MENFTRPRPQFPKYAVITGGMPYGNKELHFAHVGLMLRADTFARFMRDRIGSENVIFVSGTDCYGSPALESYRKLKEQNEIKDASVQEFVARNHKLQKETFAKFNISFNLFGASALGREGQIHTETSQEFFDKLYRANMISKQSSWQFYDCKYDCLLNGRQVVGKCPINGCQSEKGYADECDLGHQYLPQDLIDPVSNLSGEKPKLVRIENWYFNLEKCNALLTQWLDSIACDTDTNSFMVKEIREFFKKPEIYIKKEFFPAFQEIQSQLPPFTEAQRNENSPSATYIFENLTDREKACEILTDHRIHYRTGKTLTPFRLTGDIPWGVPCKEKDGLSGQTFYVWPESLWAPISFTKAYLEKIGKDSNEWKKYWCNTAAKVYQFIGEDNLYFYGPAQQALWLYTQGQSPIFPSPEQALQTTKIVPIKSLLLLNKKASSSGIVKAPKAKFFLDYYTSDQFRMHFLGMNLGNNNISFSPKVLNPDAPSEELDPVLKEGNLLTNVYNRILRTFFYSTQKDFESILPFSKILPETKEVCRKVILDYERFMYDKKFHQVINVVDVFVRNINKYWVKNIKEADNKDKLKELTVNTAEYIRVANILLHPMAPEGTEKVAEYLGLKPNWQNWENIFDDIYECIDCPQHHTIKALQEKEDFFKKHQSQLDEIANRNSDS